MSHMISTTACGSFGVRWFHTSVFQSPLSPPPVSLLFLCAAPSFPPFYLLLQSLCVCLSSNSLSPPSLSAPLPSLPPTPHHLHSSAGGLPECSPENKAWLRAACSPLLPGPTSFPQMQQRDRSFGKMSARSGVGEDSFFLYCDLCRSNPDLQSGSIVRVPAERHQLMAAFALPSPRRARTSELAFVSAVLPWQQPSNTPNEGAPFCQKQPELGPLSCSALHPGILNPASEQSCHQQGKLGRRAEKCRVENDQTLTERILH